MSTHGPARHPGTDPCRRRRARAPAPPLRAALGRGPPRDSPGPPRRGRRGAAQAPPAVFRQRFGWWGGAEEGAAGLKPQPGRRSAFGCCPRHISSIVALPDAGGKQLGIAGEGPRGREHHLSDGPMAEAALPRPHRWDAAVRDGAWHRQPLPSTVLTHGTATRPGADTSLAVPPPDAGGELGRVGGLSDLGENRSFGAFCRARGPGRLGGGLGETLCCWQ